MQTLVWRFAAILIGGIYIGALNAQTPQVLPGERAYLYPANPASTDTLRLLLRRTCDVTTGGVNLYRVSMSQNNITVLLGSNFSLPVGTCPPQNGGGDEIELGRLPAGSYTLTVLEPETPNARANTLVSSYPFTVIDARAEKTSPWVRLDFSGHWWDPADPGWGLFIWQDARAPADSILAAWFTYAADGKPQWYVFQPTWQSHAATTTTPMMTVTRPPGTTSPPSYANPPIGSISGTSIVGIASLDFTGTGVGGVGKITYKFGDGPTLVRTIRRFVP